MKRSSGFTLVEMIMVIVITGIIGGMVAVFIRAPVEGYVDSVRRAELTDAADVALRRITRDVRLALPNSLRTATNGFEFILTKSGGRYRDPADGSTGGDFLDFTNADDTSFHVLGTSPANPPDIADGDFIVVYNLGTGHAPADAYSSTAQKNITAVTVAAGTPYTVTMDANVFAEQTPPLPSPNARFQVVAAADKVVRYECNGGTLMRHAGCDFTNTSTGCSAAILAGSATTTASCTVEYEAAATGRNGLLYISLTLSSGGESVTLFNQIHVDNAP